jgi:membrane-bound lytic murein transglycosylase B
MLPLGRAHRRAPFARVPDRPFLVEELPDRLIEAISHPEVLPWGRRRRAWRWALAALIPVVGFVAGWTVTKPDGQVAVPNGQAPAVAAAAPALGGAGAALPSTAGMAPEEAQRLGQEAADRWLEDWAAVARLAAAGTGATGDILPGSDLPSEPPAPGQGQEDAGGALGIPALMLEAYQAAEKWASGYAPGCDLSWTVVAGVGRVESNHGTHGGAGFTAGGDVAPPIRGIPLDGREGVKRITDTDDGRWDGDKTFDRAVGPMQFIPTSWQAMGRDGNGDGVANPHNAFDAAASTAAYLCRSGNGSLADRAVLERALHAYNHSASYVRTVLNWADAYKSAGVTRLNNPPAG